MNGNQFSKIIIAGIILLILVLVGGMPQAWTSLNNARANYMDSRAAWSQAEGERILAQGESKAISAPAEAASFAVYMQTLIITIWAIAPIFLMIALPITFLLIVIASITFVVVMLLRERGGWKHQSSTEVIE